MKQSRIGIAVLLTVAAPFAAHAETPPPLITVEREIALAEGAGPPHLSQKATIYVLKRGGFEIVRGGDNGFACIVTREDEGALEPQCFDPEGVATLLPVAIERARLIEDGLTRDAAQAKIALGYASGKFRAPKRGGVTYMLSSENRVFNGEKAIAYPPHVMVMAPYLTNADIGADFSDPAMPWVLNEGRPDAYVIVVVNSKAKSHKHK